MAAFSSLALLGLGLAGGLGASRLARRRPPLADVGDTGIVTPAGARRAGPPMAPGPTPPDAGLAASVAVGQAQAAAKRQRRRAGATPTSGTSPALLGTPAGPATARLQPRALLGG